MQFASFSKDSPSYCFNVTVRETLNFWLEKASKIDPSILLDWSIWEVYYILIKEHGTYLNPVVQFTPIMFYTLLQSLESSQNASFIHWTLSMAWDNMLQANLESQHENDIRPIILVTPKADGYQCRFLSAQGEPLLNNNSQEVDSVVLNEPWFQYVRNLVQKTGFMGNASQRERFFSPHRPRTNSPESLSEITASTYSNTIDPVNPQTLALRSSLSQSPCSLL